MARFIFKGINLRRLMSSWRAILGARKFFSKLMFKKWRVVDESELGGKVLLQVALDDTDKDGHMPINTQVECKMQR